ncbi:conserved hypothetical protein [delta proteobacterium NaphS2]|nr:conserved hypothetical protein [delta proteobacterium NaphS2]
MSKTRGHIPMRTCIACGVKREKKELIRLVLGADGVVVRDRFGKGRGAYICGNEDCLSVLKTNKGLNRAFRRKVSISVDVNDFSK